jgi:hypothetical protein
VVRHELRRDSSGEQLPVEHAIAPTKQATRRIVIAECDIGWVPSFIV